MVYVVKQTTSGYVQAINYLVGFGFLTLTFSGSLSFWLTVLPVNRLYTSTSILFETFLLFVLHQVEPMQ